MNLTPLFDRVLTEGDHVVFACNAGDDVVLGDIDYVIVRERDLLAIVADGWTPCPR